MKLMSDKVFLDTNILVYSYSNTEPAKQNIARNLILAHNSVISTQVLQELCNVITKKFKLSFEKARLVITECSLNNELHINQDSTILLACSIAEKYSFSFYDSLIVASALESKSIILFSEDLQDGQLIEQTLTIKNPFI
ncbi:PIN domain-containing protein [soil metagenome]